MKSKDNKQYQSDFYLSVVVGFCFNQLLIDNIIVYCNANFSFEFISGIGTTFSDMCGNFIDPYHIICMIIDKLYTIKISPEMFSGILFSATRLVKSITMLYCNVLILSRETNFSHS